MTEIIKDIIKEPPAVSCGSGPPFTDDDGFHLVDIITTSWTKTYAKTIERKGPGQGNVENWDYVARFSQPSLALPVPIAVLQVYFKVVSPSSSKSGEPELSFFFAVGELSHSYGVVYSNGIFVPSRLGGRTLGRNRFEKFMDRLIKDHEIIKSYQQLSTDYEESRLISPPYYPASSSDEFGDGTESLLDSCDDEDPVPRAGTGRRASLGKVYAVGSQEVDWQTSEEMIMQQALRDAGLPCYEKVSLEQLLTNIFDAADEQDEGLLRHKEISGLLISTFAGKSLGLQTWDIRTLLTIASENKDGMIDYKTFVQSAPEFIQILRVRRESFEKIRQDLIDWDHESVEQHIGPVWEAVEMLHQCELDECTRVMEVFEKLDPAGWKAGFVNRAEFQRLLLSKPERFSNQEGLMLMQFMPQTEENNLVPIHEFRNVQATLRCHALHNALVEANTENLRRHLVLLLRKTRITEEKTIPLWDIKHVLLEAHQLNLTRAQIHVLLCMMRPDFSGIVDAQEFLAIMCTVIPMFFNPTYFLKVSAEYQEELAIKEREREAAELAALTQSAMEKEHTSGNGEEGEKVSEKEELNAQREQFEKALIMACSKLDESHRGVLSVDTLYRALRSDWDRDCDGHCTDPEIIGFAAELCPEGEEQDVAYVDHIRTWMPIMMELRKSKLYQPFLQEMPIKLYDENGEIEPGSEHGIELIDLTEFENEFPLFPQELCSIGGNMRRRLKGSVRQSKSFSGKSGPSAENVRRSSSLGFDESMRKGGSGGGGGGKGGSGLERRGSVGSGKGRRQSASSGMKNKVLGGFKLMKTKSSTTATLDGEEDPNTRGSTRRKVNKEKYPDGSKEVKRKNSAERD